MKLALGTVQFGLQYGVANTSGQPTTIETGQMLHFANNSGINMLDTAISYGNSESVLGQLDLEPWNIVTKLPAVPTDCYDLKTWVQNQVHESLKRLNQKCLYGLLLHRPEQLLGELGPELYDALLDLKAMGLVQKIGISVYGPEELEYLFDQYVVDLVQAPLNILDRRLIDSGWANRLKKAGVEVHTRSVFLQGLLLMPPDARPAKFNAWGNVWRVWDYWLAEMGLTPIEACLRYSNSIEDIDRVVVGVDTLSQLREVVAAFEGTLSKLPIFPHLQDNQLISPVSWGQL